MKDECIVRQHVLLKRMNEASLGALVIAAAARTDSRGAMRYIADYYVPVFEEYFVLDSLGRSSLFVHDKCGYDYAAKYSAVDEIRIIPPTEYDTVPGKCVAEYVNSLGTGTIAIAGNGFSHQFFSSFRRFLNAGTIKDYSDILSSLMSIKSLHEAELAAAATELNESTLTCYANLLSTGMECLDAVASASRHAYEYGAEDLYWMVSYGEIPRTAFLSENWPREMRKPADKYHYAVLEHSASGGHFGEVTQLFSFGKPKAEYFDAFNVVCDAIHAAADAIRPGCEVGAIARASEKLLIRAGYMDKAYAENAAPSIGHSQGYDIYEPPRITRDNKMIIKEGMRLNLHPSVSLCDGAMITFCDCYIVESNGARRLSSLPYEIITV